MLKFVLLQLQIENIILQCSQIELFHNLRTCIKILRNVGVFIDGLVDHSYGSVLLGEYKGGEGEVVMVETY